MKSQDLFAIAAGIAGVTVLLQVVLLVIKVLCMAGVIQ
jgi:hypothetical protein